MLLIGQVLKVGSRQGVTADGSPWQSTDVHILDGVKVHEARLGREFPVTDTPRPGETVAMVVEVSAFKRKNGASEVSVTLLRPADAADLDAVLAAAGATS
jgi:hypothetical protein